MLCRACMRKMHEQNPLHRVKKWVGSHFETSHLWEVGSYILVPHQGNTICGNLRVHIKNLGIDEGRKDAQEVSIANPTPGDRNPAFQAGREKTAEFEPSIPADDGSDQIMQEEEANRKIDAYIEEIYGGNTEDDFEPMDDDEPDDGSWVLPTFLPQYLSGSVEHLTDIHSSGHQSHDASDVDYSHPSSISYVRVIHTNGIHHIGMISCSCHGADQLPTDLVAANLIPSSFKKIRTIFTVELLDQYRLCNLEMKATAHQFYHYLRRITSPLDPASVINVMHEFRRLTRLWRWMKKLKWAGYGHNGKDPLKADKGELANFCVACPQEGKNIADDWREHNNAWMYRMQLAADGNFKADHVKLHRPGVDVWLVDGGGISPNTAQYADFLRTAAEIPTVSGNL